MAGSLTRGGRHERVARPTRHLTDALEGVRSCHNPRGEVMDEKTTKTVGIDIGGTSIKMGLVT